MTGREGGRRGYSVVPDVGDIPSMGFGDGSGPPITPTAPDGIAWRKCCEECQYRDRPTILLVEAECRDKHAAFYCVHRDDGGHYRVCAGFAARDRSTPPGTGPAAAEEGGGR